MLPTNDPPEMPQKRRAQEKHRCLLLEDIIAKYVMLMLGEPSGLLKIHVRALWGDHYRANVLVGTDAVSARVAHSYFLTVDGEGTVVACTPEITRQY
jgi:hypothetical protein